MNGDEEAKTERALSVISKMLVTQPDHKAYDPSLETESEGKSMPGRSSAVFDEMPLSSDSLEQTREIETLTRKRPAIDASALPYSDDISSSISEALAEESEVFFNNPNPNIYDEETNEIGDFADTGHFVHQGLLRPNQNVAVESMPSNIGLDELQPQNQALFDDDDRVPKKNRALLLFWIGAPILAAIFVALALWLIPKSVNDTMVSVHSNSSEPITSEPMPPSDTKTKVKSESKSEQNADVERNTAAQNRTPLDAEKGEAQDTKRASRVVVAKTITPPGEKREQKTLRKPSINKPEAKRRAVKTSVKKVNLKRLTQGGRLKILGSSALRHSLLRKGYKNVSDAPVTLKFNLRNNGTCRLKVIAFGARRAQFSAEGDDCEQKLAEIFAQAFPIS